MALFLIPSSFSSSCFLLFFRHLQRIVAIPISWNCSQCTSSCSYFFLFCFLFCFSYLLPFISLSSSWLLLPLLGFSFSPKFDFRHIPNHRKLSIFSNFPFLAFTLTLMIILVLHPLSLLRIHTQTGVGARQLENHFKNKDWKKGDGQLFHLDINETQSQNYCIHHQKDYGFCSWKLHQFGKIFVWGEENLI